MFILKPTEDTRAVFRVVRRHPIALCLIFLPAMASAAVATAIYYYIPGVLFALLGGAMFSIFLTNSYFSGQIGDNWGTATRQTMPFQYWRKMVFWICAYIFMIWMTIGYAVQEKKQLSSEPSTATLPRVPAGHAEIER